MLPVGGESSALIQGDFMKKTVKKLALAKETLRSLDVELGRVAGGVTTTSDLCTFGSDGCPTGQFACGSARCGSAACGTSYC